MQNGCLSAVDINFTDKTVEKQLKTEIEGPIHPSWHRLLKKTKAAE